MLIFLPKPKISVIISVYNTEKYLNQCLDSTISQTLKKIEIICVDDGSTDLSLNILKEFADKVVDFSSSLIKIKKIWSLYCNDFQKNYDYINYCEIEFALKKFIAGLYDSIILRLLVIY